MFDYYKAWDKFAEQQDDDADKDSEEEKDEVDAETGFIPARNPKFENETKAQSQAEMFKLTSGARPGTKLVIKGGTIKKNTMADDLKQQGNTYFVSTLFDKAIDCYTRAIPHIPESSHEMRCVVYSNRAQCYLKLKKYEQGFMDADKALEYDANHLKSVQRRGTASYYTKRYRQARRDFMRALKIEHSAQILDYLTKVQEQILKAKNAASEHIKRKALFDSGVNYFDLERAHGDADDAKRLGMAAFKNTTDTDKITVVEMNLDEE